MARTVPGRGVGQEGIRIPDPLLHMAGSPIVAGASPTPTGQWRDVALARNLAWVADGMGAQLGMTWRTVGLTGLLTYTMRVRLPVPSASHARVRLRVWATGDAANDAAISIASATVGPSSVFVGAGPFGRYPAPASDVIIDAGPDVVVDPAAGPYVDLDVVTVGTWGKLESVHLDLVEAGAPANYPTNDTTLASGAVGAFVPGDTDDCAAGLPLGADTLFEHIEQWPEQWDRRKMVLGWAEFDRPGGGLPPRRLRSVLRIPAGGGVRVTLAAYLPAITNNGASFDVLRAGADPRRIEAGYLGGLYINGAAPAGWHMVTFEVPELPVDFGAPAVGLDALASIFIRCRTATPSVDSSGVGEVGQLEPSPTPAEDAVLSVSCWVG